jgi:glutathione synthase/RimK-type ligase-like ATP-grasp enzyme
MFLGIYREPEFSPGRHLSNDAKILRLVGQALERAGVAVRLATLEEARGLWKKADLVFSMCQGPGAIAELTEWKKQGAYILNDPEASRRTYRDSLCSAIREKDLRFPHSEFLATGAVKGLEKYRALIANGGAWLKRSDVHATQSGDVVRLESWQELAPALAQFMDRGLAQAVLQKHCAGDEVKFYAVKGGRLFWPYYPKDSEGYPFDDKELQALAEHAAKALDISIYGGDAIISAEGKITLIDLNDWPSFAPCRGAAAGAIAKYLKEAYDAIQNRRSTLRVPSPLVGEG